MSRACVCLRVSGSQPTHELQFVRGEQREGLGETSRGCCAQALLLGRGGCESGGQCARVRERPRARGRERERKPVSGRRVNEAFGVRVQVQHSKANERSCSV